MIAPVCHWLDRLAIAWAAARMPSGEGVDPRLEEAARLSCCDTPFVEPPAAQLQFADARHFTFPSPQPSPHEKNNTVFGRLYRADEDWRRRPAVVLVHGWNDTPNHYFRFPRLARKLNRAGINAVTLELPYHFHRRPLRLGFNGNFLSPDFSRTVRNATQAVADIRALAIALAEQGCPRLGILGVSLGGWLGGLAACHESRFAAVILIVPVTRLDRLLEEAAFCRPLRKSLGGRKVELGAMSLFAARPVAATQNVCLVEAEHDLFVPKETVEELARAWGEPEVWRYRVGHISALGVPGLTPRLANWFESRLGQPKK